MSNYEYDEYSHCINNHAFRYGFIIMDGNGSLFGTLSGNTREILHKFTVGFMRDGLKVWLSYILVARVSVLLAVILGGSAEEARQGRAVSPAIRTIAA